MYVCNCKASDDAGDLSVAYMLLVRGIVEEKVHKIVQLKLCVAVIISKLCILRSLT